MSPEKALYEFLKTAVAEAEEDSPLYGAQVLPTVYHQPQQPIAIRVGNCDSTLSPRVAGMTEQDALCVVEILSRVPDEIEPEEYLEARERAREAQLAAAQFLLDDPSLGNRVCDSLLLDSTRAFGSLKTSKNAVALIPVLINPSGRHRATLNL